MESNSVCNHTSDYQNRKTAQRESDLLITSMIIDRIGRLELLFQLVRTMTKFDRENKHQLYVVIKKTTINSAKCATTSLIVHLHRHDVPTDLLVLRSDWR